jgi:hypothetical protein
MFLLIIYLFFECNYSALEFPVLSAELLELQLQEFLLFFYCRCSFFSFSFYSFRFVLKSRNNSWIGD